MQATIYFICRHITYKVLRGRNYGQTFNDRIDARISTGQKELIKYASVLRGIRSVADFVVYCVINEATKTINDNNVMLRSLDDKKTFIEAILNPPAPNANLKKVQLSYSNQSRQ